MHRGRLKRRRLGVFYTPKEVAQALTDWAIRTKHDSVFDSSFGGCSFLVAALETLTRLGNKNPLPLIHGVDVDPTTAKHLVSLPGFRHPNGNFKIMDFLDTTPASFRGGPFSAIVGNPPYVRHHTLSDRSIDKAQQAVAKSGYRLPRTSGYWAYFVLHSLSFLAPGGRMALVLPSGLLTAQYAKTVRSAIESGFAETRLLVMQHRLFEDALSASVILLATGWTEPHRLTNIAQCEKVAAIRVLSNGQARGRRLKFRDERDGSKSALLPRRVTSVVRRIRLRSEVRTFGDLASVKIGVVTGSNGFFILSKREARGLRLPAGCLRPIITSSATLKRPVVTKSDVDRLKASSAQCLLLRVPKNRIPDRVKLYTRRKNGRAARENTKCRQRRPWYRITDLAVSPAFLTYMSGHAPRLVLNKARVLCTNAIHRVWWKEVLSTTMEQVVSLSFLTSLAGLTAESHGRNYGGGALKLEPSDASKILLALPKLSRRQVSNAFGRASTALMYGRWREARGIADRLVLRRGLGLSVREIEVLRSGHERLLRVRLGE
jgi:adenine-specific DNA-methyltransferase